jgi:WD40 repeat protein/serine/threonine protein kinase
MNAPESDSLSDQQWQERLLEYDAALAGGASPWPAQASDLAEEFCEGFSCLDMLERLRLSEFQADVSGAALTTSPPHDSLNDAPAQDAEAPARLGRFEILRVLGQGGCGVVFLAKDPALNRVVALKIPRPEALLTREVRQRFLREGRAAGCLNHPNLVPIFEAGEVGAICYLTSPYCPGITLKDWLRQRRAPILPHAAALLIATLADAMHYAHQKGVCHRDLKPSNILLEMDDLDMEAASGTGTPACRPADRSVRPTCKPGDLQDAIPKIIDFGLAKVLHEAYGDAVTRSGAVFGTPQYMAPEQAEGKTQAIGPATDVHGLGMILYELLTDDTPYQGDTDLEILRQVIAVEPRRPRDLRPAIPRDLETICLKCLEKEPGSRYESTKDLADDLKRFRDGQPIQARPIGRGTRALKWFMRRPRMAAATSLLLLSIVAVAIAVSIREFEHHTNMEKALEEAGTQKARADERDWMVRNQHYASQMRAAWLLKSDEQLPALRDLLLAQKPGPGQKDVRGFEWRYLWRFGQGFMRADGHGRVTAVAYSANGAVCASGSVDGAICLFDRHTGRSTTQLQEHAYEVRSLDFLKEDTLLLSTAFDKNPDGVGFRGEYILWRLGTENTIVRRGQYYRQREVDGHSMFASAPAARVLFVIDRDSAHDRVLRIDLDTGMEQEILSRHHLFLVASTPRADKLALVHRSADERAHAFLEIVDPVTRKVISSGDSNAICQAEFSPDGMTLALDVATPGERRAVEFRDVPSLRLRKSFDNGATYANFRFDWSGRRLAIATLSGDIHFIDTQTYDSLGSHGGGTGILPAFSPDGAELAIAGNDVRIRTGKNVFDSQDDVLPGTGPTSEAWCLAFAPDGRTLAAGYDHEDDSKPQTLLLWDLKAKKAIALAGHDATVMALAVSPDGKSLATASYDRTVCLWDLATGKCRMTLEGHTGPVRALAFSPDGRSIASGGSDLSLKIWNTGDGSLQTSWRGHDDMIRSLAFSPDGNHLISAANDRTIKIWHTKDWTLARRIANEAKVQAVACSPDGAQLASGNEHNNVELWDIASGALVMTLPGHSGKVRSVAFAPDGKTLASGGEDKTVRLWNLLAGQETLVFPTEHFINALAFDPRSRRLAAALHDGTVKLWAAE